MTNFNLQNKFNFPFLPGMVIAFTRPDLSGNGLGTIKAINYDSIELTTGETVNKALVFNVLSKEKIGDLHNARIAS